MNILNLFKRRKEKLAEIYAEPERSEILISGSGGQGIILAGRIFAEAASIYDKKEVVMTQSYGPEARGGASRVEVLISSEPIDYPKVIHADVLLTMTQESLNSYGSSLKPDGLLIVDDTFVKEIPDKFKNVFKASFSSVAVKLLESQLVANVIALGSLAAITKLVSKQALVHALLDEVSKKILVLDRVAVDVGFKLVEDSHFHWGNK